MVGHVRPHICTWKPSALWVSNWNLLAASLAPQSVRETLSQRKRWVWVLELSNSNVLSGLCMGNGIYTCTQTNTKCSSLFLTQHLYFKGGRNFKMYPFNIHGYSCWLYKTDTWMSNFNPDPTSWQWLLRVRNPFCFRNLPPNYHFKFVYSLCVHLTGKNR